MGQPDAARPLRLEDRPGQLGRIGVLAAIGLVVQVMELADRGVAGLEHLDVDLRGDRAQLVRADPLDKPVHHLAPGPERCLASGEPLRAAGHRPLKGVAVHVGHAGQDHAGQALGVGRRGAGLDRAQIAARVDLQPDRVGKTPRATAPPRPRAPSSPISLRAPIATDAGGRGQPA